MSGKLRKKNYDDNRRRILLSLSLKKSDEYKIFVIANSKYELQINKKISLSGRQLLKQLMIIGLKELNKKYGEVDLILKKEGFLDD